MSRWVAAGLKSNDIAVFSDLRTLLQDSLEGCMTFPGDLMGYLDDDFAPLRVQDKYAGEYAFDIDYIGHLPNGQIGYGKWLKDW